MLTWKQVRGPSGVSIVFPSRLDGRNFEFLDLSADSGLTLIACGAESGAGGRAPGGGVALVNAVGTAFEKLT